LISDKMKLLKNVISEFAQKEIAPLVNEMEKTGEYPIELTLKMGKMGIPGLIIPDKYSGAYAGHMARIIALEEISKVCPAIGVSLVANYVCIWLIEKFGTLSQKEEYLPKLASGEYIGAFSLTEPSGGSDITAISTLAKEKEGKWEISGKKALITNSPIADFHILVAKTQKKRSPYVAFIVDKDTPGFSPGKRDNLVGLRGLAISAPLFNGCILPKDKIMGKIGEGLRIALKGISWIGRSGMASVCLGICEACLAEAVKFAKERILYKKPISQLQAIQNMLAEMYMMVESARVLVYKVARMLDDEKEPTYKAALAKFVACENAIKCAKMACEIQAGYAATLDSKSQRYLRDALACQAAGGTPQANRLTMLRYVMKTTF